MQRSLLLPCVVAVIGLVACAFEAAGEQATPARETFVVAGERAETCARVGEWCATACEDGAR